MKTLNTIRTRLHPYAPCPRLRKVLSALDCGDLSNEDQHSAVIICRALHEFAALDPALQPGGAEPLTCQLCHDVAERKTNHA